MKMLKTNILVAIFVLGAAIASGQKIKESEVPTAVKDALSKQFPNAKVTEWEKENGNYEAELGGGKQDMSVVFEPGGKLVETEREIKPSELPVVIQEYISKNLGGKNAKEASLISDPSGKKSYEAEVENVDYIFDDAGTLIRKEEDKEKDDDKD